MPLMLLVLSLVHAAAHQPDMSSMTTYQMVILKKGSTPVPKEEAAKMQQAHLANLAALNERHINVLWGPVLDDGDMRGIAVLAVPSPDEARKLFDSDPYVQRGAMTIDVKPWLGPKDFFQPPVTRDPAAPDALEHLVLGFLMRGANTSQDAATANELQKGHLAYMTTLREQGKLLVAGPFMDNSAMRGIVIYRVASVEDAKALAANDPAVKAGRLAIDAHPWMTLRGILK
jgi:uncharacterized protein